MSDKEKQLDKNDEQEVIEEPAAAAAEAGESAEPDHAELAAMLEDARGKADEHWDQCLRLQAEIDNLRKRAERDLANAHKFALEKFAAELLPVRDGWTIAMPKNSFCASENRNLLASTSFHYMPFPKRVRNLKCL